MYFEISNYEKSLIANAAFGGETYTPAGVFSLRLFSNTVDLDGIGTEITTAGYARITINNNTTVFPHTTDGQKQSATSFSSATLTAASPEIVSAGLFDQSGNLRYRKVFQTPFVISSGSYFAVSAGELILVVT